MATVFGQEVYFVDRRNLRLYKGTMLSKGLKNYKITTEENGVRTQWSVYKEFVGFTPEQARSNFADYEERASREREEVNRKKIESSSLYLEPRTMIRVRHRNSTAPMEVVKTNVVNLHCMDANGQEWNIPKNLFIQTLPDMQPFSATVKSKSQRQKEDFDKMLADIESGKKKFVRTDDGSHEGFESWSLSDSSTESRKSEIFVDKKKSEVFTEHAKTLDLSGDLDEIFG